MTERSERIVVVKLADLGDVLLCEPALRSLRQAFPGARIDLLTTSAAAGLVPLIGHVDGVRVFPKGLFDDPRGLLRPAPLLTATRLAVALRLARYDRVVILHHLTTPFGARKFAALAAATAAPVVAGLDNGRGAFLTHRAFDLGFGARHEADYMLAVAMAAGGVAVAAAPRVTPPASVGAIDLPERYALLFPATGAFSRAREWAPERFGELAIRLSADGFTCVVVGGADASDAAAAIRACQPDALDLTGRTSLSELARIVASAEVVIGGDSFVGHLAAALCRPVVSIFGPSNAAAWRPLEMDSDSDRSRALVARHDIPCAPCMYTGFRLGRREGCADRTCLKRVTVEQVHRLAIQAIKGSERR